MSTRLTPVRMHGHVEFVRIEVASSGGGGGVSMAESPHHCWLIFRRRHVSLDRLQVIELRGAIVVDEHIIVGGSAA